MDIAERLNALDLTLFAAIESQSLPQDKEDWLAVQRVIRLPKGYDYLEIGSHLGGSIQQHLVDPLCNYIMSVDKRPLSQPDDRGDGKQVFHYEGNSTQRMWDNLVALDPIAVEKLGCIDGDYRDITPDKFARPPQFCMIDGEHTKAAAFNDFRACLRVCDENAVISFHDAQIIKPALVDALTHLDNAGIPYAARKMRGLNFMIFLRDCPARQDTWLLQNSVEGRGWLKMG